MLQIHRNRRPFKARAFAGRIATAATVLFLATCLAHAKQPEPSGWVQTQGKGYVICDGLLKQLRRYQYPDPLKNPNACAWAVVMNSPGLKEPPWQDIDVGQQEELLFQFYRSFEIGPKNYAAGIKDRTDRGYTPRPESYSREEARKFLTSGGTLQVWRAPLPASSLLRNNPATNVPLNIVNMRMPVTDSPEGLGLCPQVPKIRWGAGVMLANEDLTAPDPRQFTDAGGGLPNFNGSALLLFGGVLHRFKGDGLGGFSISRDDLPLEFCRLEYRHPKSGRK
jgi:hypothetical protein